LRGGSVDVGWTGAGAMGEVGIGQPPVPAAVLGIVRRLVDTVGAVAGVVLGDVGLGMAQVVGTSGQSGCEVHQVTGILGAVQLFVDGLLSGTDRVVYWSDRRTGKRGHTAQSQCQQDCESRDHLARGIHVM